jgi:hypothetical protein
MCAKGKGKASLVHADLKMTMRYAHLSQGHMQDAVNLLNGLPRGKGTVKLFLQSKKADNFSIANLP